MARQRTAKRKKYQPKDAWQRSQTRTSKNGRAAYVSWEKSFHETPTRATTAKGMCKRDPIRPFKTSGIVLTRGPIAMHNRASRLFCQEPDGQFKRFSGGQREAGGGALPGQADGEDRGRGLPGLGLDRVRVPVPQHSPRVPYYPRGRGNIQVDVGPEGRAGTISCHGRGLQAIGYGIPIMFIYQVPSSAKDPDSWGRTQPWTVDLDLISSLRTPSLLRRLSLIAIAARPC